MTLQKAEIGLQLHLENKDMSKSYKSIWVGEGDQINDIQQSVEADSVYKGTSTDMHIGFVATHIMSECGE